MPDRRWRALLPIALLGAISFACAGAGADGDRTRLMLGTTHTLEDSGLLDLLVAAFDSAQDTHRLSTVVAGSGEVLTMARLGDLDVLLTHSPEDELAFMTAGHGEVRQPVMRNEFVLVGPDRDRAGAAAAADVLDALRLVQDERAVFVSRGDGSGTHRRELTLWAQAGRVPGGWASYVEVGGGMADALRLAAERGAYTLVDCATWRVLGADLGLRVVQRDDAERLGNHYSVIVVSDARNPAGARAFADWVRSPAARALIAQYGSDGDRSPLFIPEGD